MDYIDIYCERLAPGFWAEPLNAVTNLSFIVAAFCAFQLAEKRGVMRMPTMLLIALLTCIGMGSFLFHTFANTLTLLADVIPILLYQIAFIWVYALCVMRLPIVKTAGLFAVFVALTFLAENAPREILNGSLGYAPSILFLAGFGVWHLKTRQAERSILLIAAGVFLFSLLLRSIDMAVCEALSIGTHYWWHTLNGVVLYMTTRAFIQNYAIIKED